MKRSLKKALKFFGWAFSVSYALMLIYGIGEIGLAKMQPWIFLGVQLIVVTVAIKTQLIYNDLNKMYKREDFYGKG
jgi:hypothetical protein